MSHVSQIDGQTDSFLVARPRCVRCSAVITCQKLSVCIQCCAWRMKWAMINRVNSKIKLLKLPVNNCASIIMTYNPAFHWLANVNSSSCSLYVVVRPSVVCLSSVTCALLRRLKFSAMFLCHLVPWPSVIFV